MPEDIDISMLIHALKRMSKATRRACFTELADHPAFTDRGGFVAVRVMPLTRTGTCERGRVVHGALTLCCPQAAGCGFCPSAIALT